MLLSLIPLHADAGIAAAQWLSLRLQLLAAAVITCVAALGVASTAGVLPAFASYHHRSTCFLLASPKSSTMLQ